MKKRILTILCLALSVLFLFSACGNPVSGGSEGYTVTEGGSNGTNSSVNGGDVQTGYKTYEEAFSAGDLKSAYSMIYQAAQKEGATPSPELEKYCFLPTEILYEDGKGSAYTSKLTYNEKGLLTEMYAKNLVHEYTKKYTYDDKGNMLSETKYEKDGDLENTTVYTYDDKGNMTSRTYTTEDGRYNKFTYTYDEKGNLVKEEKETTVISSGDYVYTYTYDEKGNKTVYDDGFGHKTLYAYDANGNLITETEDRGEDGGGQTVTYTYDDQNRLLSRKWQENDGDDWGESTYQYDNTATRYFKGSENDEGEWEKYEPEYNEKGNIVKLTYTTSEGATRIFTYDGEGRALDRTSTSDGKTTVISVGYDEFGNRVKDDYTNNGTLSYRYTVTYGLFYYADGIPQIAKDLREGTNGTDSIHYFF